MRIKATSKGSIQPGRSWMDEEAEQIFSIQEEFNALQLANLPKTKDAAFLSNYNMYVRNSGYLLYRYNDALPFTIEACSKAHTAEDIAQLLLGSSEKDVRF